LRGKPWIDTGASQEQKFLDSVFIGCVNDIGLNDKVIVDEVSRVGIVGVDASDLGCGQENVFWSLTLEKILYILLDFKIQLLMGPQDEVLVSLRLETTMDGRANEARMTSNVDFGREIHKVKVEVTSAGVSCSWQLGGQCVKRSSVVRAERILGH
jgi:hypothetical protein